GAFLTPIEIPGSWSIKKLATSAHRHFVCAIWSNVSGLPDRVYCWGVNSNGQLGLEIPIITPTPEVFGDDVRDFTHADYKHVNLGIGVYAVDIAAGERHVCAVLNNGGVKCWGTNANGQLGLDEAAGNERGDTSSEMGDNLPYVNFEAGRTAKSIHAGANHTCVIMDNNQIKCWGANAGGVLGQGHATVIGNSGISVASVPSIDLGTGRSALSMTAGANHNCAVLNNMQIKCWGSNSNGQLGLGHINNIGDNPGEMGDNLPHIKLLLDP
ncbi:MAG: hypothetical protein OEZ34_01105, partial [Spirochaetia bacterium]|nr:hypothetical protein [Spirochaetia bacterium]